MNKKLLFAAVSLAALTACSTDDFESQNIAAEKTSPVQFEVINNNDSFTRAYMDGSNIHWEASKGDLFTLYHGGALSEETDYALTGYQNATYTAVEGDGAATLTTPSMIKKGYALMIWPVDTAFTNNGEAAVAISIPETLDNIENNITYASDLVEIGEYDGKKGAPNTAGYNRKYPVYMRPLTSQLTLKADYAGTEKAIAALYEGTDPINPIKVTSVDLTSEANTFTQTIPLNFKKAGDADKTRWGGEDRDNAWSRITGFGTVQTTGKVNKLTTTVLTGNESAKFLILPQSTAEAANNPAVVVNTIYGKVTTASYITDDEKDKAWYKMSGTTKEEETTVQAGMKAVFDAINTTKVKANTVVKDEPVGVSATRYVKVLLNHIDMADLHVKDDKQLYDAVRVWKKIGAPTLTVFLDGDSDKEFKISQKTIAKINEINAAAAKEAPARKFTVKPCTEHEGNHNGNTIVITGGGEIPADLTFIVANGGKTVPVALNKGENWKWNSKNVMVAENGATGIKSIINRGTFANDATATLKIMNNATTAAPVSYIGFENALGATWNITAGDINVQFNVTNNGTVNIAKGAEYHQDKADVVTTFTNQAETVPERFYKNDADPEIKPAMKAAFVEKIGVVNNSGVFAAVSERGQIYNYGLIEHADKDAKTYITKNQTTTVNFATKLGEDNKMGRINLPIENKDELDVSIKAAGTTGFVSVTVASTADMKDPADATGKAYVLKGGALDLSRLGTYVNYCIIKKGVKEITAVSEQIKYIEFDDEDDTEIAWNLAGGTVADKKEASYDGLMILSPVNINLTTKITVNKATFLAAKLYVGGKFLTPGSKPYEGYFGKTTKNVETMYITY